MPKSAKSASRRAKKSRALASRSAAPVSRCAPAPSAARNTSPSSAAAASRSSAPASSPAAPARRTRSLVAVGPRIKIGDAMRARGLDELFLANLVGGLLSRLEKPRSEKLLLEAIKETCRLLEAYPPSKPAAGPGGLAPNVPVHLITFVPRPERALPPAGGAGIPARVSPPPDAASPSDAP